jgi:hypothetical protein
MFVINGKYEFSIRALALAFGEWMLFPNPFSRKPFNPNVEQLEKDKIKLMHTIQI